MRVCELQGCEEEVIGRSDKRYCKPSHTTKASVFRLRAGGHSDYVRRPSLKRTVCGIHINRVDLCKGFIKACDRCNKPHYVALARFIKYQKGPGKGTYCSKACMYLGLRRRVKRICRVCGVGFETMRRSAKIGNGIFCSWACLSSGENPVPSGGCIGHGGYDQIWWPSHPLSMRSGKGDTRSYVLTHRAVYWQSRGYSSELLALLVDGATVHHVNGRRLDNRPSNLELRVNGNHPKGVGERDMVKSLQILGYSVIAPPP